MVLLIVIVVGVFCVQGADLKPVAVSNATKLNKRAIEEQSPFGMLGLGGQQMAFGNSVPAMQMMMPSSMFFMRPLFNLFQPLMSMAAARLYAQNAFNANMMVPQTTAALPERDEELVRMVAPFEPMEDGAMATTHGGGNQVAPVSMNNVGIPKQMGSSAVQDADMMEGPGESGVNSFMENTGNMINGHMGFEDVASWKPNHGELDSPLDRGNMEHFVEQAQGNAGIARDDLSAITVDDLTPQAVHDFFGPERPGEDMNPN